MRDARSRSSCGSAFVLAAIFVPAAVFVPSARSLSALQILCAQPRPTESDFLLGRVRWHSHFMSPNLHKDKTSRQGCRRGEAQIPQLSAFWTYHALSRPTEFLQTSFPTGRWVQSHVC